MRTGRKGARSSRSSFWPIEITLGIAMRQPFLRLKVAGQIAVVAIALALGAVWLMPHRTDIAGLQNVLQHHRAAPLVFLFLHLLASLLFLPRTAMAAVAGLVFGVWWGAILAAVGSVIGAVAGFLIARYINDGMLSLNEMRRIGGIVRRL